MEQVAFRALSQQDLRHQLSAVGADAPAAAQAGHDVRARDARHGSDEGIVVFRVALDTVPRAHDARVRDSGHGMDGDAELLPHVLRLELAAWLVRIVVEIEAGAAPDQEHAVVGLLQRDLADDAHYGVDGPRRALGGDHLRDARADWQAAYS